MTTKNILTILLVSLYLVQLTTAQPTNIHTHENYLKSHDLCHQRTNYATMAPSEGDSNLAASLQLLKITLFALQEMTLTYATKAKTVSDQLLKDAALKENQSDEVKEFHQKIQQFEEKFSSCNGIDELFKLVEFYSTVSSEFYEMEEQKTLTADSKIILEVLKKYKSQEMDDEFEQSFNTFVDNFAKKFDELKEDLKQEKGETSGKIVQWWQQVKNLKTYDEKIKAFASYVKLYETN
ncbi:uncharacterized protein LOC135950301 [Calliphora vicina]|uniref:uncharacterized protein LOC135950301 n=1 Tax=Calliphora vicina TaxID=7373 RepID=UPI00325A7A6C